MILQRVIVDCTSRYVLTSSIAGNIFTSSLQNMTIPGLRIAAAMAQGVIVDAAERQDLVDCRWRVRHPCGPDIIHGATRGRNCGAMVESLTPAAIWYCHVLT